MASPSTAGDNVLICLFDGDVKTVDIHLKPEAVHFGCRLLSNCALVSVEP